MRIIYIANLRLPTEKAHGIQVMKTCESLASNGADVTLVIPSKRNLIIEDPFDYYKVEKNFRIIRLPAFNFGPSGSLLFFVANSITFYISLYFFLLTKNKRDTILYTRGEVAIILARFIPKKLFFWETHIKPKKINLYRKVFRRASGIITVTKYYAEELLADFKIPKESIFVAPDAVELKDFLVEGTKDFFREKVKLPKERKIVLYAGQLYSWKGVQVLAESANFLDNNIIIVIVGGADDDLANFREQYGRKDNILVLGQKPYSQIKYYLKAADVLVIPNSARSEVSMFYTSPLKLFEYMTSGVPIIASDLPSFREVLTEENAIFFVSDNSKDLAKKIQEILSNKELAENISKRALYDVENYTWLKRGNSILSFIEGKTNHE